MADWPDTTELAQVLNVENVDDWETTLDRVLAAAIAHVKFKVGDWVEVDDVPTDAHAQAALRAAELIASRPGATPASAVGNDPAFLMLLYGSRRSFGIA